MEDDLTPEEQEALDECEREISEARKTWRRKGAALRKVREGRLYRKGYKSFEAYVEARWEMKARYAHYLAAGADRAEYFEEEGAPVPEAAKHVIPLSSEKLSPEEALRVWRAVLNVTGGPGNVKGDLVEHAVREYLGGRPDEERKSGGKLVLSDEARVFLAAAEKEQKEKGKVAEVAAPLVAIPPTEYGDGKATGPVLVPQDHIHGNLDRKAMAALGLLFERYYETEGKKGPVMNLTNEHVGWALWTLNLITGCGYGCVFCYAREIAKLRYPQGFAATVHPERFLAPSNTKIPKKHQDDPAARRVFLMSQGDWMDPAFNDEIVQAVLDMCAANPEWEFMTLTKQPERLKDFTYPPNVWVGVTVTRQGQVKGAEEAFAAIDASVRWISFEPLHGHVVLSQPELVDLYVIGAERKTNQRPEVKATLAQWVDALRLQARGVGAAIWEKENLDVRLREMPTPRRHNGPSDQATS